MCLNGQCHNSPGSYYCQCNKGYSLSPDGAFCLGKLRFINKLDWILYFLDLLLTCIGFIVKSLLSIYWPVSLLYAKYFQEVRENVSSQLPIFCDHFRKWFLAFTMFWSPCSIHSYNYIDSSLLLCSVFSWSTLPWISVIFFWLSYMIKIVSRYAIFRVKAVNTRDSVCKYKTGHLSQHPAPTVYVFHKDKCTYLQTLLYSRQGQAIMALVYKNLLIFTTEMLY